MRTSVSSVLLYALLTAVPVQAQNAPANATPNDRAQAAIQASIRRGLLERSPAFQNRALSPARDVRTGLMVSPNRQTAALPEGKCSAPLLRVPVADVGRFTMKVHRVQPGMDPAIAITPPAPACAERR